jgi:N utilization substance protein B
MKVKSDPRHRQRAKRMQALFSYVFQQTDVDTDIAPIIPHISDIDTKIQQAAPEWPIAQINRVDLAILRLAIFELIQKEVPYKVVIDEAVELAKEYGSDSSPKFINGVLGTVLEK